MIYQIWLFGKVCREWFEVHYGKDEQYAKNIRATLQKMGQATALSASSKRVWVHEIELQNEVFANFQSVTNRVMTHVNRRSGRYVDYRIRKTVSMAKRQS